MLSFATLPFGAALIFGQEVQSSDLVLVGLLVLLEGVLSIDNALVLGLLAKRLPKHMRAKALSYGLIGAFVFRVIAISTASFLLQWTFVKFLGGAYLVFIALKHLLWEGDEDQERVVVDEQGNPSLVDAQTGAKLTKEREDIEIEQRTPLGSSMVTDYDLPEDSGEFRVPNAEVGLETVAEVKTRSKRWPSFWATVLVIELTDVAFAVDSILAAMALAGSRQEKLWVVIAGGILGVVLMRFAAAVFIRLLEKFPRFETSAYLLVTVIGTKLLLDWGFNSDWATWFPSFEATRQSLVTSYETWLHHHWPLGIVEHSFPVPNSDKPFVPHLLDFHDLRRPECLSFWLSMLVCFAFGFLPKKNNSSHEN